MRRSLWLLLLAACGQPSGTDAGTSDASDVGVITDAPDAGTPTDEHACPAPALPATLEAGHWDERFGLAGLTGLDGFTPVVRDVAPAPDGSAIVVGYFRWAGTDHVEEGVVRLRGGAFERLPGRALLPAASEGWSAAAVAPDGAVILAQFRADRTRPGSLVALYDDRVDVLGTYTGNVHTLSYVDGALVVTGTFELDGGPRGLAFYEGGAWTGAPGGDPDGPVLAALELASGELAVAGAFEHVGGIAAQDVAVWDGSTWTARDLPGGRVVALGESSAGLVAAGLTGAEGVTSASVERWNGTAWEIVGGGLSFDGLPAAVADVVVDGETILAVGCFDHAGSVEAHGLARFDGTAWSAVQNAPVGSHWFSGGECGFEPDPEVIWFTAYQRAVPLGGSVIVGHALGGIGGVPSQSISALTGATAHAVGAPGLGVSGQIADLDLGLADCAPLALASATHAGALPITTPLVALGDDGWQAVGAPLPQVLQCAGLAATREHAYLGCNVPPVAPDFLEHALLLRDDGTSWQTVGELDASVFDVATAPDGSVWMLAGSTLARFRGGAFEVIEDAFDGPLLAIGFGPAAADGAFEVVVGGAFQHVGDVEASRIARWVDGAFAPLGGGLTNSVAAIAVGADVVYASTFDEGTPGRLIVGRWDGTGWSEAASAADGLAAPMGETVHTFTSLALHGEDLLAAGYVWPDTGGRNVFVARGGRFAALGGGAAAISVDAVLATGDAILLGGSIAEVGEGAGLRPSVGFARFAY